VDDSEEYFRLLFKRFYGPLFRFFARRGFKTEECQDLIQETFLKVDRGLSGFREESSWKGWIFQIADNTASNAPGRRGGRSAHRAGAPDRFLRKGSDRGGTRRGVGPPMLALLYKWEKIREPEPWLFGTIKRRCLLYWRVKLWKILRTKKQKAR